MATLYSRSFSGREDVLGLQIETAQDCDGSLCHQPIFREDGSLNFVPPHCHLIEQNANSTRCYAILCDFPGGQEQLDEAPSRAVYVELSDSIFANYPPFSEDTASLKRMPI